MSRFWSSLTHTLKPYVPGEQPRMADLVKLNTNESPIGPSPRVLEAIHEVCLHRRWSLLAAHIRMTHVHAVVDAEAKPEYVMNSFKSYASRRLNQLTAEDPDRKRWSRHGSTRWLKDRENVAAAIRYVVDGQGEAMAVFEA